MDVIGGTFHGVGLDYTLESVQAPTQDLIDRTIAIYRAEGLTAH